MKRCIAVCLLVFLTGCFPAQIKLFSDGTDPLQEFTVQGKGKDKILIINVNGVISDQPNTGLLKSRQGLVTEIILQLQKAGQDEQVKAVVLKVDSPGGTITASDILYNEIKRFKKERKIPVVVSIMNMGASGAYYLSLAADKIMAHPTSIVGSVGVIFIRPKVYGLMDKIGVGVEVNTSGPAKDMGSPFKPADPEESDYFQNLIDPMALRFYHLVTTHRHPSKEAMEEIMTAAVFLPDEAVNLGLIDGVAYLPETIELVAKMADIQGPARVITYRRDHFADDTVYNNASAGPMPMSPITISLPTYMDLPTGFYYMCPLFVGQGE